MRHYDGYFFVGAAAGEEIDFATEGDAVAVVGDELLAGFAASDEAGRSPRLLGLASMLPARLFSIFAARNATSTSAEISMSALCLVKAEVICCRTP